VQAVCQHRPEPGQRREAGLPQALVAVDGAGFAGRAAIGVEDRRLDGHDFAVEPPLRPGELGRRLGAEAEVVDLFP
jgi:hypothetical protein